MNARALFAAVASLWLLHFCAFDPAGAQSIDVSARVGVLEGPPDSIFGLIEDATITPRGQIAVLDARLQKLRLYDQSGHLVQALGGPGRGPGEFFVPEAITDYPGGILVLDRGNARVGLYRETVADSLVLDRDVRIDFQAWDMCTVGKRVFLATDAPGALIVEIDLHGNVVRRFGEASSSSIELPTEAPQALHLSLQHKLRRGTLACSKNALTWGSKVSGQIRHFDLASLKPRVLEFTGFDPQSPEYTSRGTVRYVPADGLSHFDVLKSIVHLDNRRVLVQALRLDYEKRTRGVQSYIVSLNEAVSSVLGASLPWVHASKERLVVGSLEEPYPQLVIGSWAR